jgi:hypothetical protein
MNKPEPKIDGADVLFWAWSEEKPFGWVGTETDPKAAPIHGLAIARYEGESSVYRFSCNKNWETEQDAPYQTAEEAMKYLPEQYREVEAIWKPYGTENT